MDGKFVVTQKELQSLLSSMQPICNKKTVLDVTESIYFQVAPRELIVKSTDLEISLQSSMSIESSLTESTNFLISGKRIFEIIKEMEGDIAFTISQSQLELKSGAVDLALNIKETEEFPPFPERIENLMSCKASFLLQMLNRVAFLIPQNNASSALNGMLLEISSEAMSMVATDGHSLAQVITKKYVLSEEKKWLVPKRAVLELKKLLENCTTSEDVFLGVCGNQLVFSGKNFNFFTKLISESFPQYKPVLEKDDFYPAIMAKDPFLKTLKRTTCLLAGQFVSSTFRFKPGALKVSLHNKEVGKIDEELNLESYEAHEIESRFYAPYLLNGLQVFSDKNLQFFIKNGAKPIIFESKDDDFIQTYLVMPISLAQQN